MTMKLTIAITRVESSLIMHVYEKQDTIADKKNIQPDLLKPPPER